MSATPSPGPLLIGPIQKQSADNKLSDAFYDALEDLLLDLKTITLVRGSLTLYDARRAHNVAL